MTLAFYIAAAVALVATLRVITGLNAVHSLLYLVVSFLAVSLAFFVLGAPFIAALEVIVYAGAIMVLFIFVIMMLNLGPRTEDQERAWLEPRVWFGPALLALVLLAEWLVVFRSASPISSESIAPQQVSQALFGPYVLAVELASMLLLAGLVGAYHLTRRRMKDEG
jgi:NADH-quinone oxidoreductase subunit J